MLDKVLKGALVLLAAALIDVVWRGVPVRVVIEGPSSSSGGIPLAIAKVGDSVRYEITQTTNGVGTVFVTRIDTWTGHIEVFSMTPDGKLVPTDRKQTCGECHAASWPPEHPTQLPRYSGGHARSGCLYVNGQPPDGGSNAITRPCPEGVLGKWSATGG